VSDLVVEYAFGLRNRYVTLVGRDAEKKPRASRLSYFQNAHESGWTRTFGDDPKVARSDKLRGERIEVRDGVVRCLYCHVTQSRDFRDPPRESGVGPEAADSGIGCERCHGPGANHVAAMMVDFPDRAIVNVGPRGGDVINKQCGDCHVTGVRGEIESAPDDPQYVRSTAVTFVASRCYIESKGAMSCLSCHGAHGDRDTSAASYEAKCLACHSQRPPESTLAAHNEARASTATSSSGRVCKVNPRNDCLGCHMPKIPVPTLRTSLTDHYIRIHLEQRTARVGQAF
jgi:Cytochrome c554 and c-prime